jgi:hypothetical protein
MAIDPAGSGGWATRLGGKGVQGRMLDQVYRGLGIHGEGLFGTMKRMRKDADMAQLGQAHMSAFKVLSFANKGSPSANLSNSCVAIGCACALVADTITANPSAVSSISLRNVSFFLLRRDVLPHRFQPFLDALTLSSLPCDGSCQAMPRNACQKIIHCEMRDDFCLYILPFNLICAKDAACWC